MNKICGNCKFRGQEKDGTGLELPTGYFLCERIKHDECWKYKKGQLAVVIDGSGYFAALCVEKDFGCVAWEHSDE